MKLDSALMHPFASRIVPKLAGGDLELGNFILGADRERGTGFEASRALLAEIDGFRSESSAVTVASSGNGHGASSAGETGFYSQDWGRRFILNGGSCYVDLNHLEVCLPEVRRADDHVACTQALFRIAQQAAESATERLPDGQRLVVLANNSDGRGNSYGTHLNFLLRRATWQDIFHRRIAYQLFLAAYQASSILFTGQGKVGSENGAGPVDYQISQRADFFEVLCGVQTTINRPIINSRDEAHCGRASNGDAEAATLARLHVIFYDNNLCHVAAFLKVGVLQIILAMIEAGQVNYDLLLEDAVAATMRWSHDPGLQARAGLLSGKELTALELQGLFLEEARRFVATGACDEAVPGAAAILELWSDTLGKLRARDWAGLSRRLDWVLKRSMLQEALRRRPDLAWTSPEIRHLDQLYSSLDPRTGLYLAYEQRGLVERVVSEERIRHFMRQPPEDTRAWTRAALLRMAEAEDVDSMDWDQIRFRLPDEGYWTAYHCHTLRLANPLKGTRAETEPILRDARGLSEAVQALSQRDEMERYLPTETANRTQ